MAIDRTGISSLDAGAPDITYSGNEGVQSPEREEQMLTADLDAVRDSYSDLWFGKPVDKLTPDEFQEFEILLEMELSKKETAPQGRQMSGGQGGIGNIAMKPGLIDEYRNYKMGQEEGGEQFMSPRDYYRSLEQDRRGAAYGGIMRTGYRFGGNPHEATRGSKDASQTSGGNRDNDTRPTMADIANIASPATTINTNPQGTRNPFEISEGGSGQTPQEQAALAKAIDLSQRSGSYVDTLGMSQPQNFAKNIFDKTSFGKVLGPFIDKGGHLRKKLDKYLNNNSIPPMYLEEDETYMDLIKGINLAGGNMLSQSEFERLMGYQKPETGRDGPPIILPEYATMGGGADMGSMDADPATIPDFTFNFGQPNRELTESDLARIGAIGAADGGRIGYAGGGITDLRQGYFLGKLVKKAVRGIKKVAKSPLGKAALIGMAGFGIPGTKFGGLFGKNPFSTGAFSGLKGSLFGQAGSRVGQSFIPYKQGLLNKMFSSGMGETLKNKLLMESLGDGEYGGIDPFKVGILGASALTGLMAKRDQEDEPSLEDYMGSASRGPSLNPAAIRQYIAANKGRVDPSEYAFLQPSYYAADGGRIGYAEGKNHRAAALSAMYGEDDEDNMYKFAYGGGAGLPPVSIAPEGFNSQSFPDDESTGIAQVTPQNPMPMPMRQPMDPRMMDPRMMQMAQQQGNRRMAAEGGLMDMGGMEKDYRAEGGFVPLGGEERADDVPARLSKNEFVFTADAVRSAGGGDIDKGAEIMENLMENLEQGGQVSQQSQGLEGAREMFATQQRLGEVL